MTEKIDELLRDCGMFPNCPTLRGRAERQPFVEYQGQLYANSNNRLLPAMVEQTSVVQLMETLANDPNLSQPFQPLPVDRFSFDRAYSETESILLEDGTYFAFHTLANAFEAGVLHEAKKESQVAVMQASCSPRLITQWWLCPDIDMQITVRRKELVTLWGDNLNSIWVATYDDKPKEVFWDTSIGYFLWREFL